MSSTAKYIEEKFAEYQDFPSKGILFKDIMPIFEDPKAFQILLDWFKEQLAGTKVDYIVGLEARGFIFAPALALQMNVPFVAIRKQGKLPGAVVSAAYTKEYGTDVFEMKADAIPKGSNVVILDDVIAVGGTASAAGEIIDKAGSTVSKYLFIMELKSLKGRSKLTAPVSSLIVDEYST